MGVVERDGLLLPDIAWGHEVPAGTYAYQGTEVQINEPYRLSRYPITNAQFQCFVDEPDGGDPDWWQGIPDDEREFSEPRFPYANHPRERVSWYQAVAFCRWLNAKLGEDIQLPHEYQWQTTAVGLYPAGKNEALELYDLSGNVWEWCRNKYDNPDDDGVDRSDAWRVVRGGSFRGSRDLGRAACRSLSTPGYRLVDLGFRVAVVRRSPSHQVL